VLGNPISTENQLDGLQDFIDPAKAGISEWGTFRDSLRAPVHSWFTYPAGFSFKAVEHSIALQNLTPGKSVVYDPFMGSGTTNLVAKGLGLNSAGVEAHPFVFDITKSKMYWELNFNEVDSFIQKIPAIVGTLPSEKEMKASNEGVFPELIIKCFLPGALYSLRLIRDHIKKSGKYSPETQRFLSTALICTLRDVSIAATGWPYIAPNKVKITSMSKNAVDTYVKRVRKMANDLVIIAAQASQTKTTHNLILGSSTKTNLKAESVDHIFTSPPYLNNFDYADRTRLEMYFMGEADNWGDISSKIRTKLMTSATTQISRADSKYILNREIQKTSPEVFEFLSDSEQKLESLRHTKGGKKSYDLLVTGYFNDIYQILRDNFRVLKPGSEAYYILGDSAPYGVHIPTDELIGKLGLGLGFKSYDIELLRVRGGKWATNPQRHSVPLRETIVKLKK
jgi:DNA modification methylase